MTWQAKTIAVAPIKKHQSLKKHLISKKMRIFAIAFERQESSKQEKHCENPFFENSPNYSRRKRAFMLSLVVYAIGSRRGISSGVRFVPF
ncbi:MAG: hypothetical protein IJ785_03170 [Bacteroidales bacterium]|nr:hypothetical protein [Bacteroidales bacterium]